MANYTKTVDFSAKDALASGNAAKRILGTEINTEFNNIQTAVATKLDTTTFTANNLTTGILATANGGTGSSSTTFCNLASNVVGTLPVANGGTGVTNLVAPNSLLVSSSTSAFSVLSPTASSVLISNSSNVLQYVAGTTANRVLRTDGTAITWATVDLTTDVTAILPVANGGTGAGDVAAARTILDVPQRNGTNASGTWNINISGNAATATSASTFSGTVNVATQATGSLAIANGGTGQTSASTAAAALGVPGYNQQWNSVIGSRAINTDYQNTTGKPICVSVAVTTVSAGANNPTFWVSTGTPATTGTVVSYFTNGTTNTINVTVGPVIIPPNSYYQVQAAVGTSIAYWAELS